MTIYLRLEQWDGEEEFTDVYTYPSKQGLKGLLIELKEDLLQRHRDRQSSSSSRISYIVVDKSQGIDSDEEINHVDNDIPVMVIQSVEDDFLCVSLEYDYKIVETFITVLFDDDEQPIVVPIDGELFTCSSLKPLYDIEELDVEIWRRATDWF